MSRERMDLGVCQNNFMLTVFNVSIEGLVIENCNFN